MHKVLTRCALLLAFTLSLSPRSWAESPQDQVREILTAFSDGVRDRNIAHVQKTMGNDVVAILDGVRYDGWETLRDHALVREFSHPAAPATSQIVNVNATGDMAWAYTKTSLRVKDHDVTVWNVLVLERRGKQWKIVLLDRSTGRVLPAGARKARR